MQLNKVSILALCCAGLMACDAGNGEGLNDNGRPLSEVGASIALSPTLESLQANLFTPNCAVSGCHTGSSAPLGLSMEAGNTFANLVSKASVQQADKLRIKPGDAINSYLVQKVEGASGITGNRMPRDRARLDQALIDNLKLWINNGAPVSSSAGNSSPPVVSQSTPASNTRLSALSSTITIVFSQAMDASTLEDLTLNLLSAGGDAGFSEANESPLIIQPTLSADGLTLTLDLSANASVGNSAIEDSYQLTIKGEGAAVARDLNSQVLDGDSDGLAGGDFVLTFRVTASALLPVFSSLEADFFVPNCAKSGCHAGSNPQVGMSLEQGNAYTNIVGVQSVFAPTLQRINPGNADASAIVQALEGTIVAIPQMPQDNQGGIPQADINVLRQWINNGANP